MKKVVCPFCNYSRNVNPDKIPANVKSATCPQCGQKFDLNLQSVGDDVPPPETTAAAAPPPIPDSAPTDPAPESQYDTAVPGPDSGMARADPSPYQAPTPPPLPRADPSSTGRGFDRTGTGIPWEDRPGGLLGDLYATAKMVLFSPSSFFTAMPVTGGYKAPLTFGLVFSTFGMILYFLWQAVMQFVVLALQGGGMNMMPPPLYIAIGVVGLFVLTPLFVVLGLYVWAAILHLFLMIVRSGKGGFEATFRVLAYACAPQAFSIVPIVGALAGGVWALVLTIIGLTKVHNSGVGRILLAVLGIPFILSIILVVIVVIFVAVTFRF